MLERLGQVVRIGPSLSMFGQRMEPGLLRILLKENIPPHFTHSSCRDKHDKRKGALPRAGVVFLFLSFSFFPLIRSSRG